MKMIKNLIALHTQLYFQWKQVLANNNVIVDKQYKQLFVKQMRQIMLLKDELSNITPTLCASNCIKRQVSNCKEDGFVMLTNDLCTFRIYINLDKQNEVLMLCLVKDELLLIRLWTWFQQQCPNVLAFSFTYPNIYTNNNCAIAYFLAAVVDIKLSF